MAAGAGAFEAGGRCHRRGNWRRPDARMRFEKIPPSTKTVWTGRGRVDYLLKRSPRRRSLQITISERGQVEVAAPARLRDKTINDFVIQKAAWIARQIEWAGRRQSILETKRYETGSLFLFLGKKYPLQVQTQPIRRARIHFDGQGWSMVIPGSDRTGSPQRLIKNKLVSWYRQQAKEILGSRVLFFARQMKLDLSTICIRSQKSIWGSCHTAKRAVHLNWQLVMMPMNVIDYVVVHELSHLVHGNHSKRFWNKVAKTLPDFRQRQQWIKKNQLDLILP